MSNHKPANHADERTPLVTTINGGSSGGNHDHHDSDSNTTSPTLEFLFSKTHTPGLDSESRSLRALIYVWHVTKVTLLSSMYLDQRSACKLRQLTIECDRLCQLFTTDGAYWYCCWIHRLGLNRRIHH
jgi:hypothetical protein